MIVCMQCIRIDGWRSSPKRQYRSSSDRPRRGLLGFRSEDVLHQPHVEFTTCTVHIHTTYTCRTLCMRVPLQPNLCTPLTDGRQSRATRHLATLTDQRDFEQFAISFFARTSDSITTSLPPAYTMSRSAALLFKRISAIARPPVFAASKFPVRSFSSTIGKSLSSTPPRVPVEDNVYLAWHIVHLRRNPTDPSAAAW